MKKSKFILWGIMFSLIGVCYAGELPVNNTIQQEELQLNIFKKKNKKSRKSKKDETSAAKDSTKSKNDYGNGDIDESNEYCQWKQWQLYICGR